jgi:glycosyltransferase involved in cell wall biosynthesis
MAKNKNKKLSKVPFVSICTPTFNRRPFIPYLIRCFESQTYPKDSLEWIIIDDGTDKIEDLVRHIPQVKYFKYDEKMTLGKKRNLSHEKSSGEIIVYMDDDDYYPPERVSHAVEKLKKTPSALCAGSSEMHIYFKHINELYKFGPYGPNHATAATFAFRRELLKKTKYDESASLAEEKIFLKDYTIPFIQLDTEKTILVFSHTHNTFDKRELLAQAPNAFVCKSSKNIDDFISDVDCKKFYVEEIDNLLSSYDAGELKHKPDVKKQIAEMRINRQNKMMEEQKRVKSYNSNNVNNNVNSNNNDDISNKKISVLEAEIMDLKKMNEILLTRIVEKDKQVVYWKSRYEDYR